MVLKPHFVSKIKDCFDLNEYETKVWLALLQRGVASAGEIADISKVPRSRTYDVLETLEKKGFAIVKLGKPVKYIGVKPRIILDKLKNNLMRDTEERISWLSNLKDTDEFSQLESLYKTGVEPVKREDVSVALKGKNNISNYLKEIIRNAKKEVIICTNAEEIAQKPRLFQQTFDFMNKQNISVKVALSGDAALIKKLREKFGVKITQVNLDAKFFIIDRTEILFYLTKNLNEDIAIWLNSPFFAQAFASLFEKAMKGDK
jgi:sugar-specific transcriptional regulator TrmB